MCKTKPNGPLGLTESIKRREPASHNMLPAEQGALCVRNIRFSWIIAQPYFLPPKDIKGDWTYQL